MGFNSAFKGLNLCLHTTPPTYCEQFFNIHWRM